MRNSVAVTPKTIKISLSRDLTDETAFTFKGFPRTVTPDETRKLQIAVIQWVQDTNIRDLIDEMAADDPN